MHELRKTDYIDILGRSFSVNEYRSSMSLLDLACRYGDETLISKFVPYFADQLDSRNNLNESILHRICFNKHTRNELLRKLCNFKNNPKPQAGSEGNGSISEGLKILQVSLNERIEFTNRNKDEKDCLHVACESGSIETVKILTESNKIKDALAKHNNGWSYLHSAVLGRNLKIVEHLLERGVRANTEDGKRWNCLHLACEDGNIEIVEYFNKLDPKMISQTTLSQLSCLHIASLNGHEGVVYYLLKVRSSPGVNSPDGRGRVPLHFACKKGHMAVVKMLVENGAEITLKNEKGENPFHTACKNGQHEIVTFLLQVNKIDLIRPVNEMGWNCLHMACDKGHRKTVELLLCQKNVNVNAQISGKGNTCLFGACKFGDVDIVSILLKKNASTNTPGDLGNTPLHLACMYNNNIDIPRLLLQYGAKVDARNKFGWTPLHLASNYNNSKVAEFLLSEGAKVDSKERDKNTPLTLACKRGHFDTVQVLVKKSPNINMVDRFGRTSLHLACFVGHERIVKLLLDNGAKPRARDKSANTPKDIARQKNYTEVINALNSYKSHQQ